MKKYNYLQQFIEILVNHEKENTYNLFPPCVEAQFTVDCLCEALLGPDYYFVLPCCVTQGNTIILDEILRTYSKEYRKLIKKKQKELRKVGKETKLDH